ncbi:hypothetical protein QUB08_22155 [Microcoleus sp. BR0-C5]|uniref:hypothetical protein n=1 Tax=Microcoleus sp. BR0-C5 TaxID=2818713 RepID=UPI002FCEDBFE
MHAFSSSGVRSTAGPKISAQIPAPCRANFSDWQPQMLAAFYLHIHKTSVNLTNVRSSYLALDEQTGNVFLPFRAN